MTEHAIASQESRLAAPRETLRPMQDPKLREAVMNQIDALPETLKEVDGGAHDDLAALSSGTVIDAIVAIPEGMFSTSQKGFAIAATVFVTLQYGDSSDRFETTDSFPMTIRGRIDDNGNPVIERVTVDTSSFFE